MSPRKITDNTPWFQNVAELIEEAGPEVRGLVGRLGADALIVLSCVLFLSGAGWKIELAYTCAAFGVVCLVELVLWKSWIELPEMVAPSEMTESQRLDWQERKARQAHELLQRRSWLERRANFIRVPIEMAWLICLAILLFIVVFGSVNPFPSAKGKVNIYMQEERKTQTALEQVRGELSRSRTELADEKVQSSKSRDELTKSLDKITKETDDLTRKIADMLTSGKGLTEPASSGGHATDAGNGEFWGIQLSWGLLLSAIFAIVVLGFVARKHKEALPVAGAAALATDALKHAGELSKMTEPMYWRVLSCFLGVSVALLMIFLAVAVLDIRKRYAAHPAEHERQGPPPQTTTLWGYLGLWLTKGSEKKEGTENYLSSLAFSVLVLLWAAVMIGYSASGAKTDPKSKPQEQNTVVSIELKSKSLPTLGPFVDSTDDLVHGEKALQQWKQAITEQKPHRGDILVLQGATDCKPFRSNGRGNPGLADDRAKKAEAWLQPEMARLGVSLSHVSVQQPERCKQSANLRNVYPLLIQTNHP